MDSRILNRIQSPAAYLGAEWGAARKTPLNGGPRWALAFPDAYEIGMSHLGIQILYHILNSNPESSAERVFTPKMDAQKLMEEYADPLVSLETQTPIKNFDIVGFSLLYEMGYSNVLRMLKLAGIPLRAINRTDDDPLIIAGGPCVSNPEAVAPFFDAFALGEGEDMALEINAAVHAAKRDGLPRSLKLERLAEIEGVYVPVVHDRYGKDFEIIARRVADLDAAAFPTKPVVPSVEAIHDRAVVEIARGCPHACRYCHAGFIGRPLRERKPETVWKLALDIIANTGYQDLTLLSLSSGDYKCLTQLVTALASKFGSCGVAVNLPSLRADSLTSEVIEQIKSMRKTGFTIAPEAGSARLRAVINKDLSEDEILKTARIIFENGWDLIKLYFMFGLPTETEDDLREICRLVRAVRKEGLNARVRPRINVSLSAFVPKPHTPFQWESMLGEKEIQERLDFMLDNLRIPGVNLKWSPPYMSVLEGVFARGDRRLAPVIERAVSLGASFDAWSEGFNPGIWKKAFEIEGLNPSEFASRGRGLDEPLPWRHLKIGADFAWLASEREKALGGELTLGCENAPCADPCGACDREVESIRYDKARLDQPCESVEEPRDNYARLRLVYSKTGPARYIGHLDTVREFHRSLRRAGIRIQYTEGFHPKARLGFGDALPVGVGSVVEMVDVWVHKSQDAAELPDRLNGALPEGFRITDAREIAPNAPSIESATRSMRYRFDLGDKGRDNEMELKERESRYEAAPDWPIEKTTKSGAKRVDLKKAVARIAVLPHGVVEMEFSGGGAEGRVKPRAAFESVFGELPEDAQITKVAAGVE